MSSSSVAWTVFTISERLEAAERLASSIGADLVVHYDADPSQRIRHQLAAWKKSFSKGKRWSGVLEDDVIPCRDFALRSDLRLKEARRLRFSVVSFFSARKEDQTALEKGEKWRRQPAKGFLMSQCLAMQSPGVPVYEEFVERFFDASKPWIDVFNARFFSALGKDVQVCVPNLVDHDLSLKSTLGHPSSTGGIPRKSKTFRMNAR